MTLDYFLPKRDHPCYQLYDHGGGFDSNYKNWVLSTLPDNESITVNTEYIVDQRIQCAYPNIKFTVNVDQKKLIVLDQLGGYNQHPAIDYTNFVCTFNGTPHVSRKLLTAALHHRGWFDPAYSSKNFEFDIITLDGHVADYVDADTQFYQKFFITDHSEKFFQTNHSFEYTNHDVSTNIYKLESKLTQSFIHVVSETLATSNYPFVTEKFMFSVATRGLFLAYAQPEWHQHLEQYFGFKRYTRLFDYSFDNIKNPVVRLVELLSMISKFEHLSPNDWYDLYLLESDTIEYNYEHFRSGNWIKHLAHCTQ